MSSPPQGTTAPTVVWISRGWFWPAAGLLAVMVFYWIPLTSENASIQWDAVDVHLSAQQYFSGRVVHGELPFWTPYIFSGFPFLADPQVAAWYPLNWPFFLAGVSPRAIQVELVVHAFVALLGSFLLFRRIIGNPKAAIAGAFFYAFSGFFAEHSSHVGMFTAASLLPWLLLGFELAVEGPLLRPTVLTGIGGGLLILAGHFQTALYAFAALGLFAIARLIERPQLARRIAGILGAAAAIAILLSMIQTLPGLELTRQSIRASANYSADGGRALGLAGLLNLIWPNATGVFDHPDGSGITDAQYYLYSGFLLIPLAIAGFRRLPARLAALAIVTLPLWYMLGPAGGLYRLSAILPGFRSVRSPVHFWFVPVLGLALLAASGAAWVFERWNAPWVPAILLAVVFVDLYYWNSLTNPLAYARYSFDQLYGAREQLAREKIASVQAPLTRFSMPDGLTVFGPLNHPLDLRMETTYGYNPLELASYAHYREALRNNPLLQNGLGVSRTLDTKTGAVLTYPAALPRAYFAPGIVSAANAEDELHRLASLDPSASAMVAGPAPPVESDPRATVSVEAQGEQTYRVKYRTAAPALLKLSIPYYPGWEASVDGQPSELLRVDGALMGLVAPGGDKTVMLHFRSRWFGLGAWLSALTITACAGLFAWPRRRRVQG